MSHLSKGQLLAARALPREEVSVPELGGTVIVQGMSAAQRDAFEASLMVGRGRRRDINTANLRAKLIAFCVVDEAGLRVFSDEDVTALGEVRVDVVNRIFAVAQRLSGVSEEDIEELGRPSASARVSPSVSVLPATSDTAASAIS